MLTGVASKCRALAAQESQRGKGPLPSQAVSQPPRGSPRSICCGLRELADGQSERLDRIIKMIKYCNMEVHDPLQ